MQSSASARLLRTARGATSGRVPSLMPTAAGQCLAVVLAIVAACLWASLLACRAHDGEDGAGGQSGDEGRKAGARWLGTGGVAAELLPISR